MKKDYLFLIYLICFFSILTILRFLTTASFVQIEMLNAYTLMFSVLFALICCLYDYSLKNLILCTIFIGFYVCAIVCKLLTDAVVSEREILCTVGVSIIFYASSASMLYFSSLLKGTIKKIIKVLAVFLLILFLLAVLIYVGYFFVNEKNLLDAECILAIFQTNLLEVKAYLLEKNLYLLSIAGAFILGVVTSFVFSFTKLKPNNSKNKILLMTIAVLLYNLIFMTPKMKQNFVYSLSDNVIKTLKSYKEYEQGKEERYARLENLKGVLKIRQEKGLYVVVIGESTTREHMSGYGYKRLTTPWLNKVIKQQNTILFKNAYSNHTHTVPALQYALSEKNQYNDVCAVNAYSLTEIVKAAGFETYWISNQERFMKKDIPVAVISRTTNKQKFINEHVGQKIMTTYYDDKLVEFFPKIDNNKNNIVFFHLMGCHAVYKDRYPKNFKSFKGKNKKVDEYDDAILYNDFVLSKIYERVSKEKSFKGLIYISDHGEEPDKGYGHESSKFTYQMSKIPFVMIFSNSWIKTHKNIFEILKENQDKYWTSDLFYDVAINIFGIKNIPNRDEKADISSRNYDMSYEKLKTLHGQRYIKDEKEIDN
ncbi:MAG: sulfatase-like hydrolase/transferase [Alphaproteobacteria bacterium]|nr:sulfatase-like hydrolase/transferase [Alphaproteobacteria bacterium]